jgi:nitrite reductase/ring-hydroxylating ferredoxin subunit
VSTDSRFADVGMDADIAEGSLKSVEVAGQTIALARVGGVLCAIGGICTHQQALLAEGELDGEVVTCPLHMSGFNVKTGAVVSPPAKAPVPVYDVRVEAGRILVSIKPR